MPKASQDQVGALQFSANEDDALLSPRKVAGQRSYANLAARMVLDSADRRAISAYDGSSDVIWKEQFGKARPSYLGNTRLSWWSGRGGRHRIRGQVLEVWLRLPLLLLCTLPLEVLQFFGLGSWVPIRWWRPCCGNLCRCMHPLGAQALILHRLLDATRMLL